MSRPKLDPLAEAYAVDALREHLKAYALEEDDDALLDTIEGETNFFEAVDEVLATIVDDTARAEGLAMAIRVRERRREAILARAERARGRIAKALEIAELKSVACAHGTASLRAGPQKVEVISEDLIPDVYWKQPPRVLDKQRLRDDLKAGASIDGATLSNGAPSLSIRVA